MHFYLLLLLTLVISIVLRGYHRQRRDQIRIDGPFILCVRSAVDIVRLDLELR